MKHYIISILLAGSMTTGYGQMGNVGIGTTTPQAKLHVYGGGLFQIPPPAGPNDIYGLAIRPVSGNSATGFAPLLFQNIAGNTIFAIQQEYGANDRNIFFSTDNYNNGGSFGIRMAIDRMTGNVGIGTGVLAPQGLLDVRGTIKSVASTGVQTGDIWAGTSNVNGFEAVADPASGDAWVGIQRSGEVSPLHVSKSAGTASGYMVVFNVGGVTVGSVTHTTSSVAYNTTSDFRLKENIQATQYGLATINAMQVYDYTFKAAQEKTPITGVMAQELYKVFPQAVKVGGSDAATNPWQVDYSKLTPVLIKSVQELSATVAALQELVNQKDQKNAELSERLKRVEQQLGIKE